MFAVKLLANLVAASDCYNALNMFEHVFTFHISHITLGINYNWLLSKAVNVLYVYVQFKRTNQSYSPSKISQSLLNGALVMQMVNNSFIESKKNYDCLIKRKRFQSKKIEMRNYTSTRFCSEQHFGKWIHFQISFSLWELQVIKNLLRVKDIAGITSNRLLLLLILRKNHVSLQNSTQKNCVEFSF